VTRTNYHQELALDIDVDVTLISPNGVIAPSDLNCYRAAANTMRSLLDRTESTCPDICFKFAHSSEVLQAHKCILMAKVPYFVAMFNSDMTEARSGEVLIKDHEIDVMKELLTFIYTSKFSCEQISTSLTQEVLLASIHFGLDDLEAACVERLAVTFDKDNIAAFLLFSDAANLSSLKTRCIDFAMIKCPSVMHELKYTGLQAVPQSYVNKPSIQDTDGLNGLDDEVKDMEVKSPADRIHLDLEERCEKLLQACGPSAPAWSSLEFCPPQYVCITIIVAIIISGTVGIALIGTSVIMFIYITVNKSM
jgi:hypothetical protein